MQTADALQIVGYLAGLSPGWTDDTITLYAAELETLDDFDACIAAARTVMRSWTKTTRPPLATIIDAYNTEKARRDADARRFALGTSKSIPVSEGLKIAWAAYVEERQRQGLEPNRRIFENWAKAATS